MPHFLGAGDSAFDEIGGHWGTLYGPALVEGQYWRLFSYALEHGDPIHLLFNASAIWSLGTALERLVGSWRFFLITLSGTLGCAVFALVNNFDQPLVGASGAILGWAGALLPLLNAQGRRALSWTLVQVAVISLLPQISFAGHLGGFLFGVPFGLVLRYAPAQFNRAAGLFLFLSAIAGLLTSNPARVRLFF